jgi:hypothetical protein
MTRPAFFDMSRADEQERESADKSGIDANVTLIEGRDDGTRWRWTGPFDLIFRMWRWHDGND